MRTGPLIIKHPSPQVQFRMMHEFPTAPDTTFSPIITTTGKSLLTHDEHMAPEATASFKAIRKK